MSSSDEMPPEVPARETKPLERFWPYVDLPEQPTPEELAALHPDLAEALFGAPPLPFSVSVEFSPFEGPDYARAMELARASAELKDHGSGPTLRHRARFYPPDVWKLHALFEVVARFDSTEVLVDDKPIPYARELWLPLMWLLMK